MALVKSKSECIKVCTELLEQFEYDLKRAKAPERKRQLKRSLEFWEAVKYHLEASSAMETLFARYVEWSHSTFGSGEPIQGLTKLEHEVKEAKEAVDDITEYADMIMCIFYAYSCAFPGETLKPLLDALSAKLDINMKREWVKQPDGTYQSKK